MVLFTFILTAAVIVIDQLAKYLVVEYLKPVSSVEIIPNLFSLKYVENRGAAFGIFQNARWIFIAVTLVVVIFLIILVVRNKIHSKLFTASMILIIGGGVANLIDRIFLGYVVDYLSLSFFSPVCNFADYCITVGACLLAIFVIFFYDNKKVQSNE